MNVLRLSCTTRCLGAIRRLEVTTLYVLYSLSRRLFIGVDRESQKALELEDDLKTFNRCFRKYCRLLINIESFNRRLVCINGRISEVKTSACFMFSGTHCTIITAGILYLQLRLIWISLESGRELFELLACHKYTLSVNYKTCFSYSQITRI